MASLAFSDTGQGEPIVFVHGLGSDHTRWAPITELLADNFRCIAVDLPGHGDSPADGCDALSAASAVHDLVTALDLSAPVVVGHSLGSTVALLYGVLHRSRSIVAVDPVHLYTPHLSARLAPLRERLLGDDFDAAFAEFETGLRPDLVPEPQRSALAEGFHPNAEVVRSYWRIVLDPDAAAGGQERLSAALATLCVPALICLADPPTPEDAAVLRDMSTAIVEVYDGMGHWLHLVDPPWFAQRVRSWIEALDS
jgi:pimeloyl-ACP methyl ester carboxylesterase